jgi:hypothetical protein
VSRYAFGSAAIDPDDGWLEVWPVGESRGREMHLRSWPALASVLKANEYLADAGRLRRIRKLVDVQEDLQRRYELIQRHAWSLPPIDLPRAVKLAPLPGGTVFSKQSVRADYTLVLGVREASAPLSPDEAEARARALGPGDHALVTPSTVLGHPAYVAAANAYDEAGRTQAAQRSLIIAPVDHPIYVELTLRSDYAQSAAAIDHTLAAVLERAELALPAEGGAW